MHVPLCVCVCVFNFTANNIMIVCYCRTMLIQRLFCTQFHF